MLERADREGRSMVGDWEEEAEEEADEEEAEDSDDAILQREVVYSL